MRTKHDSDEAFEAWVTSGGGENKLRTHVVQAAFRMGWNAQREREAAVIQHSDAPWRFDAAPTDAGSDALRGHILPHGAGEDDPAVAWVENVGATDLAIMLAGPDMLAVLESIHIDLVDYAKRLSGAYDTGAIALGSCADQVWAVVRKAKGERP